MIAIRIITETTGEIWMIINIQIVYQCLISWFWNSIMVTKVNTVGEKGQEIFNLFLNGSNNNDDEDDYSLSLYMIISVYI